MAIKGKVTNVLNKTELIINVGRASGIREGMKFKVVSNTLIKDPDTGEELGELEREKIKVEVFQVEAKFSLARTYEVLGITALIKTFDEASSYETFYDQRSLIKVGDRVVQILEELEEKKGNL